MQIKIKTFYEYVDEIDKVLEKLDKRVEEMLNEDNTEIVSVSDSFVRLSANDPAGFSLYAVRCVLYKVH